MQDSHATWCKILLNMMLLSVAIRKYTLSLKKHNMEIFTNHKKMLLKIILLLYQWPVKQPQANRKLYTKFEDFNKLTYK